MKRTITLLLVALMLLTPLWAALAEGGKTFTTEYYTLTLPQDWEIDTSDLDKDEDFQELGTLLAPEVPGLVLEAGLVHYSELDDVSLWNMDEAGMQDYIDSVLEELGDGAEYKTTLRVGNIPFVVCHVEDSDGPYEYIDTMTNGYAVVFYAYVADDDSDALMPMSDAEWAQVESIIATFKPVT